MTISKHSTRTTRGLLTRLQRYFFSGLLFCTPIFLTGYVVVWFVQTIDSLVKPLIPEHFNVIETYSIPGYGIIIVLIGATLMGALTKGFLGEYLLNSFDRVVSNMPIIRGLYSTLKQVSEAVLDRESSSFKHVGLIEYPSKGHWSLCFVTGDTKGEVQDCLPDNMLNIFVPTTPNPTSGFLLFVPKKKVMILDMSVEAGIKMVVSIGVISPTKKK